MLTVHTLKTSQKIHILLWNLKTTMNLVNVISLILQCYLIDSLQVVLLVLLLVLSFSTGTLCKLFVTGVFWPSIKTHVSDYWGCVVTGHFVPKNKVSGTKCLVQSVFVTNCLVQSVWYNCLVQSVWYVQLTKCLVQLTKCLVQSIWYEVTDRKCWHKVFG